MTAKECTKCGLMLPLTGFTRDRTRRDGYHPHCRDCRNVYGRVWQANSPERRAYAVLWRAQNRQKMREYYRTYRKLHAERLGERRRELYALNAEQRRTYQRQWRERHREKYLSYMREYERMKRARQRSGLVLPFTQEQLSRRLSMFPGCWICCGESEQVDHVKPVARGGPHILANLRPICAPCNHRKLARWPLEANDLAAIRAARTRRAEPSLSSH